ncbi:MAG: class I adenylate-forming enzyme family protein [Desulfobacterales bacterium]
MTTQHYVEVTYEKNNILEHVKESIARFPDRELVISGDGSIRKTYRQVNERANRLARLLQRYGVKKGDRVALFENNRWQYFEQYLAILKLGAICVPMNFRLKSSEALFILNQSGAVVLLFEERYTPIFEPILPEMEHVKHFLCTAGTVPDWAGDYERLLAESSPEDLPAPDLGLDDICAICYTSGTTGLPKGSIATHRNIMVNFYSTEMGEGFDDPIYSENEPGYPVFLNIVPLYHIAGIISTYAVMSSGAAMVLPDAFTPKLFMETVQREKVSITYLVPTMFHMILEDPDFKKYDLTSLKSIGYGAMPMNDALLQRILREFPPDIRYSDNFGCTECNATSIAKRPEDHDLSGEAKEVEKKLKRLKGVGVAMSFGIETRIVDEHNQEVGPGEVGEIVCRGDKVTPGYWQNPEATAKAIDGEGWFHTGDMGWKDEDGFFYFADRAKDMINRGGENIYPMEVERVIAKHPKVMDVAVYGGADPKWGHIVAAAVVLRPGETLAEEELISFCKADLASYKVPTFIDFVDSLPRTFEGGKVKRNVLREEFAKKHRS